MYGKSFPESDVPGQTQMEKQQLNTTALRIMKAYTGEQGYHFPSMLHLKVYYRDMHHDTA